VLLLHEPTQGVDVATRAEIYEIMRGLCDQGTGVLWVTTDFDELAAVCQRIAVCDAGRIVTHVPGPPFSRDRITSEVYAAAAARGAREPSPVG
jgi:ribose transport system ATP-binding protein